MTGIYILAVFKKKIKTVKDLERRMGEKGRKEGNSSKKEGKLLFVSLFSIEHYYY